MISILFLSEATSNSDFVCQSHAYFILLTTYLCASKHIKHFVCFNIYKEILFCNQYLVFEIYFSMLL
jgi:hypothetical protein